jgi:hypothetical protein
MLESNLKEVQKSFKVIVIIGKNIQYFQLIGYQF